MDDERAGVEPVDLRAPSYSRYLHEALQVGLNGVDQRRLGRRAMGLVAARSYERTWSDVGYEPTLAAESAGSSPSVVISTRTEPRFCFSASMRAASCTCPRRKPRFGA